MPEQWDEPQEADIEYYVAAILSLYREKIRDIQMVLRRINIETLTAVEERAVIRQINEILRELNALAAEQIEKAIDHVYEHGRARALVALNISDSLQAAKRYLHDHDAPLSQLHRAFLRREKETFTDDLLAATQHTERRVKSVIREIAAERIRDGIRNQTGRRTIATGIKRDMIRRLGDAANTAIRDSAGRRWKLDVYVDMVTRTKLAEAQTEATRNEAIERGALYAVVSRHGDPCDRCKSWQGRILRLTADTPGNFPTLEDAKADGLLHPNCLHTITPVRDLDFLPVSIRQINGV